MPVLCFYCSAGCMTVATLAAFAHNAPCQCVGHYGNPIGPLAMLVGELGQVRKEAAAAYDACAGMWLVGLPPNQL